MAPLRWRTRTAIPKSPGSAIITIPAGTRLALVLTSPVSSKTVPRGDTIVAQGTAPVVLGNSVAIPARTLVQDKLNKLIRDGSRAEMQLESVSVLFPGVYVARSPGRDDRNGWGIAWHVASKGRIAAAVAAPAIGSARSTLVGHSANGSSGMTVNSLTINPDRMQSPAIGAMAGLAIGGMAGLVLLAHGRQFFVDLGSRMELNLPHLLTPARDRVMAAVHQSVWQPALVRPVARRPPPPTLPPALTRTCSTPDKPGTPPTVIPETPPLGDMPGTPDIVIPGTPSIPGTTYPCD